MISLKPIDKRIRTELKERMKTFARTTTPVGEQKEDKYTIVDLNSRSTFVKMTSGVKDGSQEVLGENTQFGLDLYGTVQNDFRPIAGIKDISIEYKGGYKAFRHGTINWTCWSFEDLDKLLPHFLVHGRTILLEWGWALSEHATDVNLIKNIDKELFENNLPTKILENSGNYDAMMGVISNYEWSVRDDGGFDCTTEITSMGVNLFKEETKSFPDISGEIDGLNFIDLSSYVEQFDKQISKEIDSFEGNFNKKVKSFNDKYDGIGYFKFLWDETTGIWQKIKSAVTKDDSLTYGLYMTWGWMEDNIISKFLSKVSDSGVVTDFRSIDTLDDGTKRSVQISNHPKLLTTDFTKFVLAGDQFPINNFPNEAVQEFAVSIKNTFGPFKVGPWRGNLRDIILPYTTVKEAFTGIQTLEAGLNNLFNILNSETGIWDFKIVQDEKHNGRLKVIDMNTTENSLENLLEDKTGKLFVFPTWQIDSIVSSQTLTSKLPSAMAVSSIYGTHTKAENNWSVRDETGKTVGEFEKTAGTEDTILTNLKAAWSFKNFGNNESKNPESMLKTTGGLPIHIVPEDVSNITMGTDTEENEENIAKSKEYSNALVKAVEGDVEGQQELYADTGLMKSKFVSVMKYAISKNAETSITRNSGTMLSRIIPVELELEIDGVGGIFPGNAFTSAYLPERYKKEAIFQVINTMHSIDSSGWIVTIKGQMRLVPRKQKAIVRESSKPIPRKEEISPNDFKFSTSKEGDKSYKEAEKRGIRTTRTGRTRNIPEK